MVHMKHTLIKFRCTFNKCDNKLPLVKKCDLRLVNLAMMAMSSFIIVCLAAQFCYIPSLKHRSVCPVLGWSTLLSRMLFAV